MISNIFEFEFHFRFPKLPLLCLGKENLTPMELCTTELTAVKKLTGDETKEMIKKTAVPCDDRKRDIEKMINSSGLQNDPILQNYGIRIKFDMAQMEGRVLPAPDLKYRNMKTTSTMIGTRGQWDNQRKQFLDANDLGNWILINADSFNRRFGEDQLYGFLDSLCRVGNDHGIRIDDPIEIMKVRSFDFEKKARETILGACRKHANLKFILVILSGTSPAYGN